MMYETFYQLQRKPFQITTDPAFLWLGEKHSEALSTLKYGVMDNKGFLLLTGDVGTGKTTLINALLESLENCVRAAMISDPSLSRFDFYRLICHHFGVAGDIKNKSDFITHFSRFLHQAHTDQQTVLLIIDETQRLNHDLLEEIRLLSNIEKADAKLINIFFVGQNEVNTLLLRPENRALRKRITITCRLEPLNQAETVSYIAHRLKMAGAEHNVFSSGAMAAIYAFSNGSPRQINIICDLALLYGYEASKRTIGKSIIEQCGERIAFPDACQSAAWTPVKQPPRSRPAASPPPTPVARTNRLLRWAVGAVAGMILVVTAALITPSHFGGQDAADSIPPHQIPLSVPLAASMAGSQKTPPSVDTQLRGRTKVTATLAIPAASPPIHKPGSRLAASEAVRPETDSANTAASAEKIPQATLAKEDLSPFRRTVSVGVPPTSVAAAPVSKDSSASLAAQDRPPEKDRMERTAGPDPDPADIVDWLLKRKAEQQAGNKVAQHP